MVMTWNGDTIVDLSREFLASNGASKHHDRACRGTAAATRPRWAERHARRAHERAGRPTSTCASNKGLSERFDSTIGAGTVLMPFGGKHQLTADHGHGRQSSRCSARPPPAPAMAWGFNPYIMSRRTSSHGAYLSVVESRGQARRRRLRARERLPDASRSTSRSCATSPSAGASRLPPLLGALMAQVDLGVGAIGGKDSMSGSLRGSRRAADADLLRRGRGQRSTARHLP